MSGKKLLGSLLAALGLMAFGSTLLRAQTVTVTPSEYPDALTNPLMGFRPDNVGDWNAKPYTTIARHYIEWNEINNLSTDGVQKIIDFCNREWAGCEAANVKVIPRVILDWNGGEYWPAYLTKGDYKSQKTRDAVVNMIRMLGQAWDNDPRVAWVQTGIVGKWGEQETPNVNSPMVAPDNATWASIMGEAFEAAFPNKMKLVRNQTDWTNEGFTEMGVYWDSFGRKGQYEGAWKDILKHNELGRYLVAPVEGEIVYNSSVVAAYMGSSPNATLSTPAFYNYLIDAIKQTHCSGLGWISIYTPGPSTNAGANLVQKAYGYRFNISEFTCSARTEPGSTLTMSAKVKNTGSAVIFENYPVAFVLINESTRQIVHQSVISGTDIRTWAPGSNYDWDPMTNTNGSRVYLNPPTDNLISASIPIPSDIPSGQYLAGITILEPSTQKPGVFFAVPNFFKQSQSQPLVRIGIGADASNHNVTGPFDHMVNDDTRYYTVSTSTSSVTVSASDASAGEPADTGTYTFTRTGSTMAALTVNYTVSGTATSGTDYTALGTSVTILAGQTSATKTVTIIDDATAENSETVIVNLGSGAGYTIGSPNSATVNIADDEAPLPAVTVQATDAAAGEPNNHGEFTFAHTGVTSAPLTVNFTVSGTATSGSDYTSLGTSVTIPAGQASVTTTLAVVDNFTVEPSETVIVTLANNAAYTVGSSNTATVTIADDDVLPTVTVEATDANAAEPNDHGAFTVTRAFNILQALTVNFTVSGTATSGSDYISLGSSVTIPAGQASAVIPVTVVDNSMVEPSETVIVTLANNVAYTVGAANTATVTIADEDVAPVEAFPWTENFTLPNGTTSDPTPTSWTATPTNGNFRVLTNEMAFNNVGTDGVFTTGTINISSGPVTVSLKVRGGSGLDLGQDFLRFYKKVDGGAEVQIGAANGPQAAATWTANIASGSSLVLVIRAHVTATSEYYYFDDLSVVPNVAPPVLPTVTIAASDASAGEPSNNGAFTVTRTDSTTDALTVNFTVSGTAMSGSDYTSLGTSVTIPAGQASASVPVTVINDTTVEVAETVVVTLASNAAYTIGTANSATVNLTDDDQVGLPSPWVCLDIGAVGATGSCSYLDGTFTIRGSGADIISTADEFHYMQQSTSGDCSIVARVASIQNTHGWAKAGVMVRESTAANARNFFVFVTPSNGVGLTWRSTVGGTTTNTTVVAGQTVPKWLRITRTGNSFTAHRSDNGTAWTQVGSAQTISMATTATLGLALTSHADGTLCTITMDNVSATP